MTDPSEGTEDRDDFQYPITEAADDDGDSNEYTHDRGDADNNPRGSRGLELEINNQQDCTKPQSTNQSESQPQQCTDGIENDTNVIPTLLCKEFVNKEEADMCYREYARRVGFGLRKHNKRRNVNGSMTGRTWVCSRYGFRPAKHMEKRTRQQKARAITRTGCRTQF